VLHDLVAIDVDRLTPIEALTLLATLRDAARRLLDSE
jgi:hypothetical protein